MKKILLPISFFGFLTASNLDTEIENLKTQIRSYGAVPQTQVLEQNQKKAKNQDKNGLFLGITGAMGEVINSYEDGKYNRTNDVQGASNTGVLQNFSDSSLLFMFGGKIGYQNFFNTYFGTRVYGDVLIGVGKTYKGSTPIGNTQYALGALNLDLMGEYKIKEGYEIGGFLGFGVGIMLLNDKLSSPQSVVLATASPVFNDGTGASPTGSAQSQGHILWQNLLQADYTVNVGMGLTLSTHHRFELGVKIPITYLKLGLETPAGYTVQTDQGDRSVELKSGDLTFRRTSYVTLSYVYLF